MTRCTQAQLDPLLSPTTEINGITYRLGLTVPRTTALTASVPLPNQPLHRWLRHMREGLLEGLLLSRDGREYLPHEMAAASQDTGLFAAAIRGRNALFEALRGAGTLYSTCPSCGEEADRDLTVISISLQAPFPKLLGNDGISLAPPQWSEVHPPAARPAEIPRTTRLRFELPSARLKFPVGNAGARGPYPARGVLRDPSFDTRDPNHPETVAWRKYEDTRPGWSFGIPAFRAVLRASVVCAFEGFESSPEVVRAMPIVDFLYLDLANWLTHAVDVPHDTTLAAPCPNCGVRYLPVR